MVVQFFGTELLSFCKKLLSISVILFTFDIVVDFTNIDLLVIFIYPFSHFHAVRVVLSAKTCSVLEQSFPGYLAIFVVFVTFSISDTVLHLVFCFKFTTFKKLFLQAVQFSVGIIIINCFNFSAVAVECFYFATFLS